MKIRIARGSGDGFGVDDISCAAADHLGFFARNDLAVNWVDARGGLAAMNAVLEGKADIAYGGFGPIVSLRAQGAMNLSSAGARVLRAILKAPNGSTYAPEKVRVLFMPAAASA